MPNNKQIAAMIADNLCSAHFKDVIDTEKAKDHLEKMVNIEKLKPLLEIIALAVEGKQARSAFPLLIVIGAKQKSVKEFTAAEQDTPVIYKQNKIYLAGNQSNDIYENQKINQSNLLFGMTQFVMDEVFNNAGKPYFQTDSLNSERFNGLCKDPSSAKKLIPTLAQLIYQAVNIDFMQVIASDVMNYFDEIVIPACKDHLRKLYKAQEFGQETALNKFGKFSPALPQDKTNQEVSSKTLNKN